jgi:hypothetical protein
MALESSGHERHLGGRLDFDPRAVARQAAAFSKAATGTGRDLATDLRSALMRSISCMVWALKYDSPQLGQDHIGILSITNRSLPLP